MPRASKKLFSAVAFFLIALTLPARVCAQGALPAIRLEVDATQAPQRIIHSHMQIPVKPGPLVLYYPEWIPGEHSPTGPIIDVAGIEFMAGGKRLAWRRDLVDGYAFHLDIPAGVDTLDAKLDVLLSADMEGVTSSGASSTAFLDLLSWNQVVLYPQGYPVADLTVNPTLKIPAGWKYATALTGARENGDTIEFAPVSLDTLVDSPVLTGRYFKAIELTPGETPKHEIDIAADTPSALEMPPGMQVAFHQLVEETGALFGVRHYRSYRFLVSLSDNVIHFGLEHHESSDDREVEHSLTDDAARIEFGDLLPHEFVHSWNGKYRRPADLSTANYQEPMKDDLLWVYEGLTEYLGEVLTARSGLWTPQQAHEAWANFVALEDRRPGKEWRSLQDTADSAPFLYNADTAWQSRRRDTDFYEEGALLWLDVDTTMRKLSHNKKSLNDFCKAFYGGPGGAPSLETYTFEELVAALNGIVPNDWAQFLRTRLDATPAATPIEAIENSGWKIVYNEQPNEVQEAKDSVAGRATLNYSIGLLLEENGAVDDVQYGGPSYLAGIGPGMKINAVNGKQFSPEELKSEIAAAKSTTNPIELIVANGTQVRTVSVDYHGGLQYPHIERREGYPDLLSDILKPLAP